jgi:hypothetical protein
MLLETCQVKQDQITLIIYYATKRRATSEEGRVGVDLQFEEYANIGEVLTTAAAKTNGEYADIKYIPNSLHGRPYFGYDAKMDPTILNSICNRYVDVSGYLILNKDLQKIRVT